MPRERGENFMFNLKRRAPSIVSCFHSLNALLRCSPNQLIYLLYTTCLCMYVCYAQCENLTEKNPLFHVCIQEISFSFDEISKCARIMHKIKARMVLLGHENEKCVLFYVLEAK